VCVCICVCVCMCVCVYVCVCLSGIDYLKETLPSILNHVQDKVSQVQQAYLELLIYLPGVFGNKFCKFVPRVLPLLLQSLSADRTSVREVGMKAGEVLLLRIVYCIVVIK